VPDDVSGSWDKPRRTDVPAKVVRWGKENVMAVRVSDNSDDGGVWADKVRAWGQMCLWALT